MDEHECHGNPASAYDNQCNTRYNIPNEFNTQEDNESQETDTMSKRLKWLNSIYFRLLNHFNF